MGVEGRGTHEIFKLYIKDEGWVDPLKPQGADNRGIRGATSRTRVASVN